MLAADLRHLSRLGMRVLPLSRIVDALLEGRLDALGPSVGISFDDGTDLDWRDIDHPRYGRQSGFARILDECASETGGSGFCATSFVIAGPGPRRELDQNCLGGAGWWNDDWWPETVQGRIAVENHSWDHNHQQVFDADAPITDRSRRGTFASVDTRESCDYQVRQAADYIDQRLAPYRQCSLFAYPYGEYSDYLVQEYLPMYRSEHRMRAAFTTAGEPLHAATNRWLIPRYVAGEHWRTPSELEAILRDCN
jgi:hypothetical protein